MTHDPPAARGPEPARLPHGERPFADPFLSTGPSPTVHLVGAGKVGQAFLRLLAGTPLRLRAVSDASGTICARGTIDGGAIAAHKAAGGRLASLPGAEALPTALAIDLVAADIVVDATPTDPRRPEAGLALLRAALAGEASVVVAGKDALARLWPELDAAARARVSADAALGGTGALLLAERAELRGSAAVAIVGNATTTLLSERFAQGEDLPAALAAARARELLEADPVLDLDGSDLAAKLALVCAILWDARLDPGAIARPAVADLDPEKARAAARAGRAFRLVARAGRGGVLPRVAWEVLPVGAPLAVPSERVAYAYADDDGSVRLHTGTALGAERTARALLGDVLGAAGGARVRGAA